MLQNIFFCVLKKKVIGLKRHEGEQIMNFNFQVNYPFKDINVFNKQKKKMLLDLH